MIVSQFHLYYKGHMRFSPHMVSVGGFFLKKNSFYFDSLNRFYTFIKSMNDSVQI